TNHFDAYGKPAPFDTRNGLVATGGEWHVEKPLTAFQDQFQIKKVVERGDVALGLYAANYTQENRWFFTDILTDVRDNPRFVDLDGDPTTPYDLEPWGNGSFRHFSRSLNDWAGSIGLNYKVNDQLAAYALGSRAYKMPALDEFLVAGAQEQVALFEPRRTYMVEGGVKYGTDRYGATV